VPVSLLKSLKPWVGPLNWLPLRKLRTQSEKFKAPSGAAVTGEMFSPSFGYNLELERMKFKRMKQRLEKEQTEREAERQ
jgi:hypothetical protein